MAIVLEEKRPVFLSNWLLPSASESDVCAVRSAAIYVDVSNIKQVMSHMGGGEIVDPPIAIILSMRHQKLAIPSTRQIQGPISERFALSGCHAVFSRAIIKDTIDRTQFKRFMSLVFPKTLFWYDALI